MFERFTEAARRSVFFARYEASQFGSNYLETEHLLLGLLRESSDVFRPLFQSPDAPEAIRKEFEERLPKRPPVATSVDLPLNQEAKRALSYSAEEAERLGHRHIGVEHVMLGLLREEHSEAAKTLTRHGITLDALRRSAIAGAGTAIPGEALAGRAELHRLAEALGPDRVHAAALILEALGKDVVTVSVISPGASYVFTFSSQAPNEGEESSSNQ